MGKKLLGSLRCAGNGGEARKGEAIIDIGQIEFNDEQKEYLEGIVKARNSYDPSVVIGGPRRKVT